MKTIWTLLSIDNEYNQPDNNLVAWWENKPSFKALANTLGISYIEAKGDSTVGKILNGKEVRIYNADYRLVLFQGED